jgi:hypothetical protein
MMPRSNRVLANNEIIAPQSSQTIYRNRFGDTILYTYEGMGIVNGRFYNRCTAFARSGDKAKLLKSFEAARNFINRERGQGNNLWGGIGDGEDKKRTGFHQREL